MSPGSDRSSTNCIFPRPARVVRGEPECVPAAPSSPPPRAPISFSEPPDRSPSPWRSRLGICRPMAPMKQAPSWGADSWPPLSESTWVSPKSSSSDTQGHPMLATYKYDKDKINFVDKPCTIVMRLQRWSVRNVNQTASPIVAKDVMLKWRHCENYLRS
ncbi:uncharacterized protein LOC103699504 [Phoenix dactylifera]|uniref:Uncharacterized protein LOC103699504 n=1 Tax=Phoenix dactylifera TaxID=42345 RepID=A0A8B9AFF7_PHODC|nr:uncharacterized protein LOC103699504 [Phoenix dactylifera]